MQQAGTRDHARRPNADLHLSRRVFGSLLSSVGVAVAQQKLSGGSGGMRRARLGVIYSSSLLHSVNKNDAIAAMRVWADAISKHRGYELEITISVAESRGEMRKRLQEESPGLVLIDSVEYLELAPLGLLQPMFAGAKGRNEDRDRLLLLAGQNAGPAIRDLRGKSLLTYASSRADLSRKWLEVLLHDSGFERADRFFAAVSAVPNPSAAVLPVFFNKAGAAVVDAASFEVMKEMNPQLGTKLRVVATSDQLVDSLLCIHKRARADYRDDMLGSIRDLHLDVVGRQLLLVFKFSKLVDVDKLALDRVRELQTKYARIIENPALRGAATDIPATGGFEIC